MGDVYVEVELANYQDQVLAEHGYRDVASIRRERVRILTDTGATMLVLPQELVERLGLGLADQKVIVTYADERKEERSIAGIVTVRVGNRAAEVNCVVGPPNSEPLLGQMPLEVMDLLVDCGEHKLVPRPESPYLPLIKLK